MSSKEIKFDPTLRYLARSLNTYSSQDIRYAIDLSWDFGESLWVGKIPLSETATIESYCIKDDLDVYFDNCCYAIDPDTIPANKEYYNRNLEKFTKLCWLTETWLTTGFSNPVGGHWNPRIGNNVIHPGDTRKRAIDLFPNGTEYIDIIYFNTGGVKPDWLEKYCEPIEFEQLMEQGWKVPGLVPDHGTLIPHLHKDNEIVSHWIKKFHTDVYNRISGLAVKVNFDVEYLTPWQTTSNETVEVIFDEYPQVEHKARAIIAIWLGRDIDQGGVQVVHKI